MPIKLIPPGKRNGSPYYYIRGTVRGRRVDESTGTDRRAKAEEIRARREAELLDESIHGRRAVATFASAAESYLEQGGEGRYLAALIGHFGSKRLSQIDQAAIDAAARILKPLAAKSTINRQVHTPISAVMKHAAARGWCTAQPVERPKQPKGKTRWMTVDEATALIDAASPHLKPMLLFMLYTGARVAETVYIDWRQVHLARGHAELLDTKNGTDRGIPLHPAAIAALANLPHREGMVFRRPDGAPYAVKYDGGGQIKTAFKGACRRAGIKGATPHTMRHTWATWFYLKHRDLMRLMELGGWSSLDMVQRYAHVDASQHRQAINDLPTLEVGGMSGTTQTVDEKQLTRKGLR